MAQDKTCGWFRRCQFREGEAWIVVLKHQHAPGDQVLVAKREGTATVTLGEKLDVYCGDSKLPWCYRIQKPEVEPLRAVDLKAQREVAELERMIKL